MSRLVTLPSLLAPVQSKPASFFYNFFKAEPVQPIRKSWRATGNLYTGPVVRQGFEISWLRWLPVFVPEATEVPGIVTTRALVRFFFRLFMREGRLTTTQRSLALFLAQTCVWLHSSLALVVKNSEGLVPQLGRSDMLRLPQLAEGETLLTDGVTPSVSVLTPNLQLKPVVTYGQQQVSLITLAHELSYSVWNIRCGGCRSLLMDRFDVIQITPPHLLAWVGLGLRLTYRVKYFALDRKLRKIVKNKYRYVRAYVCIRETQRVRYGLRLLLLGSLLQAERKWSVRVAQLLLGLFNEPEASMLRQVRSQHQRVTLRVLGLV